MKLSVPHCPTCRAPAIGTVDTVPGTALFTSLDEDGHVEYEGYTEMDWDGQETLTGEHEQPLVTCGQHSWESAIQEN